MTSFGSSSYLREFDHLLNRKFQVLDVETD